jgi:hypothetical protein
MRQPATNPEAAANKKTRISREKRVFAETGKTGSDQNGISSSMSEKLAAGFGCGRAAGAGGAWRGAAGRLGGAS